MIDNKIHKIDIIIIFFSRDDKKYLNCLICFLVGNIRPDKLNMNFLSASLRELNKNFIFEKIVLKTLLKKTTGRLPLEK